MAVDWGLVLAAISVVAIPVGFGIGVVAMANPTPGEFRFAKACFMVAAITAVGSVLWMTHEMQLNSTKIILTGTIGATVAIGLLLALNWVSEKQETSKKGPSRRLFAQCDLVSGIVFPA